MFTAEQLERAPGRDRRADRGRDQDDDAAAMAPDEKDADHGPAADAGLHGVAVPVAVVNGIRVNYLQVGARRGRARKTWSWCTGWRRTWPSGTPPTRPSFAKRYRVTLYDLRGHGRSETPPGGYTPQNLARDLARPARSSRHRARALPRPQLRRRRGAQPGAASLRSASPAWCSPTPTSPRHAAPRRARPGATAQRIQQVLDDAGIALDIRDPYFGYRLLTEVARLQLDGRPVPRRPRRAGRPAARRARQPDRGAVARADGRARRPEPELMADDGLDAREPAPDCGFRSWRCTATTRRRGSPASELLSVWPHAEFRRVRDAGHFFPSTRPAEVHPHLQPLLGRRLRASSRRIAPARRRAPLPHRPRLRGRRWLVLPHARGRPARAVHRARRTRASSSPPTSRRWER